MKKFLIGCGIVAVLGLFVVCGIGIFLGLKAKKLGESMELVAQQLEAGVTKVNSDYPFDIPDTLVGEAGASADRLAKMIEVRKASSEPIRQSSLYLFIKTTEETDDFSIMGLIKAIENLGVDSEKILVVMFAALEENEMSYDEYWHLTNYSLSLIAVAAERGIEMVESLEKTHSQLEEMQRELRNNPQFQLGNEIESYNYAWRQADAEEIVNALAILAEHQEDIDQVKESFFFDIINKAIYEAIQQQRAAGGG